MSTITLLKGFNNYYNRIKKVRSSLSAYRSAASSYATFTNINFYPADGVNTTQTLNTSVIDADYLIVSDGSTIKSRWFVLEQKRNRQGQTIHTLRRDLLVDMQAAINSSTCYIEKGALTFAADKPDPAYYLDEDISFNQCPRNMLYLTQDGADTPKKYVVMYIACDGQERIVYGPPVTPGDPDVPLLTFPASRTATPGCPYGIYYFPVSLGLSVALSYAAQIAASLYGAGVLYDIQLLPYQPAHSDSTGDITSVFFGTIYKATSCDLTFETSFTRLQLGLIDVTDGKSAKVANQCEKIRLCAPGEASAFEYTPFKMGSYRTDGYVFETKVTFKPISPYIHVKPKYMRGLYSNVDSSTPTQFSKDPRGLIVAGDYSLPTVTDQWLTYQINNKNYLNAFNREVETMELQNKWSMITDVAQAISGTIGGAMTGAALGGGVGAAAGALGSAIAGGMGIEGNRILREDALDMRKDQFNYSLQNIRAMPVLLGRVSSFAIDSQVCPYIQVYTASGIEESAFLDKLKYNGMKIGRIGTFSDYESKLNNDFMYIKAKLIRCPISEDWHVVNEIADELDKGFYKEIT